MDRARDDHVSGERRAQFHAQRRPCGWIIVSLAECRQLIAGRVSGAIREQATRHLEPDPTDPAWRTPPARRDAND